MKKLQILTTLFLFAFATTIAQNKQASTALQKTDHQFFIENKGQWNAEILYMTSFGGLNAFITKKGIVYDFYELKIPNTNNALEGAFSDLKNKLRNHNGLSITRKKKFIDEFLRV